MSNQRSWPACRRPDTGQIQAGAIQGCFVEAGDFVLRDIPEDATPYPEHMPVGTVVKHKYGGYSHIVMLPWAWDPYARNYITIAGGDGGTIPITSDWFRPIPQTETITVSGPPEAVAKIRAKAEAKGLEVSWAR